MSDAREGRADPGDRAPADLPPIADALLDPAAVEALFADLERFTEVDGVQLKRGPGHVREGEVATLGEARQLLLAAAVRGVQVRYRHDGAHWLDTLLATPAGVRLVRIRHPAREG